MLRDLTFKTISVTSSLTPLIEVNSCKTPSICIDVTAAPLIEDSKILLRVNYPKLIHNLFQEVLQLS